MGMRAHQRKNAVKTFRAPFGNLSGIRSAKLKISADLDIQVVQASSAKPILYPTRPPRPAARPPNWPNPATHPIRPADLSAPPKPVTHSNMKPDRITSSPD